MYNKPGFVNGKSVIFEVRGVPKGKNFEITHLFARPKSNSEKTKISY